MKLKPTKYYLNIIDEIEKVRTKNNINWMDVLRIAFRSSPKEARELMIKINKADEKVSKLFKRFLLKSLDTVFTIKLFEHLTMGSRNIDLGYL